MSRNSYDDMMPEGYRDRGRRNGRMTAVIACIGVILTLIAIVIYLLFTPHDSDAETPQSSVDPVSVSIPEPEIIEVESAPEAAAEMPPAERAARPQTEIEKASDYPAIEYTEYTAAEGDTIASIAAAFGIDSSTIVSVNRMESANVKPGDVLKIPPVDGVLREVAEGDTLASIASSYDLSISAADLAALNGLPYTLVTPGEYIFVPSQDAVAPESGFTSPLPGGTITGRFGEVRNGVVLEGVVVSSEPGSTVLAAADGNVIDIFHDDDFGKSVRLMHQDGYSTVYYGLESIIVHTSEAVERGDIIGTIGTSSRIFDAPAVLFRVEQNGVVLDPMNMTEF